MTAFNHELCEERHNAIATALIAGGTRMTALEACGNNHEKRLAIMETVAARQANIFWQLLSPAMSLAGSIIAGCVLAYILTK